jgi:hypothetical protein
MISVWSVAIAMREAQLSMVKVCVSPPGNYLVRIRHSVEGEGWRRTGEIPKVVNQVHLVMVAKVCRDISPSGRRFGLPRTERSFEASNPPKSLRRNADLLLKQSLHLARTDGR